jgi:ElaB/YqjD/DUF883 family membrane-anchored ribosome-binding protein
MNVEDMGKEIKDRAAEAANAAPDVNALLAQAVEAINKIVDDVSRLLKTDPADTVAAIKDAGKAASDNIGAFAHDAGDMGRARIDDLGSAVKRNPLTWLAVAAGLGLIIGLWNGRDSSK